LSTLTNLSERLVRQAVLRALGICWSGGWLCWLMKAVISSTADGLRTVCGRLPVPRRHHTEVRFTRTSAVTARRGLAADPRMVRDLHSQCVPHLAVRVRDATGLVGPLVIPGVFSTVLVNGLNRVLAANTHH